MSRLIKEITFDVNADEITTDGLIISSIEPTLTTSGINLQDISPTLTNAMAASQREIYYYALIYFASDLTAELDMSQLENMSLLEELFAESSSPLGAVSANELTLSLYNQDKSFSSLYTSSPYYGKLLPNVLMDAFVGIKLLTGAIEYIYLGRFQSIDWEAPTSSLMANVVCNDRLWGVLNQKMPQIPVFENVNYESIFRVIFKALGLSDTAYTIDAISYGCSIVALPEGPDIKVRDVFQSLADSGLCNVFGTRDGKILVMRNNNVEANPSFSWADTDFIISADQPNKYNKTYSQVEITYNVPYAGEPETVMTISNVEIVAGTNNLDSLIFDTKIGSVDNVKLIGAINSYISSMTIGANSISLIIENIGNTSETIILETTGRKVQVNVGKYILTDTIQQGKIGNIKFSLNSDYIQNRDNAIIWAGKIINLLIDPAAYIDVSSRGNPVMDLTKTLQINDVSDGISGLDVVPIRLEYNFNMGIDCKMVAIKKSLRESS